MVEEMLKNKCSLLNYRLALEQSSLNCILQFLFFSEFFEIYLKPYDSVTVPRLVLCRNKYAATALRKGRMLHDEDGPKSSRFLPPERGNPGEVQVETLASGIRVVQRAYPLEGTPLQ